MYSLNLFSPDSLEEYNILHPMLALTHYKCFQPFSLVHLPSVKSQSFVAGILVDFLLIIIVIAPTPLAFPSKPPILL